LGKNAFVLIKPNFKNLDEIEKSDFVINARRIIPGKHQEVMLLNKPCGALSECKASGVEIQFVDSKEYWNYKSSGKDLQKLPSIYKKTFNMPISWMINPRNYSQVTGSENDLNLAVNLLDNGGRKDYFRAKDILDNVIVKQPENIQAYVELARFHMKTGFNERGLRRAEEILNIAYSINDKFANIYVLRGYVYSHQGKYNLAEKDFKKAEDIGTDNLWLNTNWGELYLKQDAPKRALEFYQLAIDTPRLEPSSNDRAKLRAYKEAENILILSNDNLALDKLMKKKTVQFAENVCYLSHWANFKLFKLGDNSAAHDLAIKAISNGCNERKFANKVYADSLIAKWHFSRSSTEGAEFYNKAVALDSEWAGRLYRFSRNEKLYPVLKSLTSKVDIDDVDLDGLNALAYAAMSNDVSSVNKLILLGANPNKELREGYTVFLLSLISSESRTIDAFIESNVPLVKNFKGGVSAISIARERGLDNIVAKLGKGA